MSTDFDVELEEYRGEMAMSDDIIKSIKAQLGNEARQKVVFALVVVDEGPDAQRPTSSNPTIKIPRCGIYAFAGETAADPRPVSSSPMLHAIPTLWEPENPIPDPNDRRAMRRTAAGGTRPSPATNAIAHPAADDFLVVTYPGGSAVGFCVWIGGTLRWF